MNPYPGLRPFRQTEADLFMGREIVQGAVITRVRISPLTLLVARSGVGKSSFLTCRLNPKLMEGSAVRYLNEWGGAPPEALVGRSLDSVEQGHEAKQEKPVVVLDQFEDVFKLPYSREPLWDTLADALNVAAPPANILISMREEWLGAWGEASDYLPASLGTVVRLAPLDGKELTRAILRPPEIEGTVTVEPALAGELIRDLRRPTAFGLGDGFVEPGLLQLVCHRLWSEAFQASDRKMTVPLYERLGRADKIIRDFVWAELGRAGTEESRFTAFDRVLWSGMTRHLVVAQGIKAMIDSTALARKIRMEDMGIAGPAVAQVHLPKADRAYLQQMPERRSEPPEHLVKWISDVLEKGAQAGFLKQQRGLAGVGPELQGQSTLKSLFELSHDSLSDLFQQFSVEFETWVRTRWAKVLGILIGAGIVAPILLYSLIVNGLLETILYVVGFIFGGIIYVLLIAILILIFDYLFKLIYYPIIRRLARGVVPMPSGRNGQHSRVVGLLTKLARMLGFLPR
jgi:hypothetical protein